jgi:hypothetical protein
MQFGTAGITWRAFAQPWGDDLRVCAVPLRELMPVGVEKSAYHQLSRNGTDRAPIQTIFLSRGFVRDEEFDSPKRLI